MNKLASLKLISEPDEFPDLSYLDEFENSTDKLEIEIHENNQEIKNHYGVTWSKIGIKVQAEINIPLSGYQSETCLIQIVESGGLYGIDNDDHDLINNESINQFDELQEVLKSLNCDMSNFEALKKEALK